MSDLTFCNYCNMEAIKARAKKVDRKVEVRPAKEDVCYLGGTDVFVDGKFVAWFMTLPDYCCC